LSCPSNQTCSFNPTTLFSGQKSTLTFSGLTVSTPNPFNLIITGVSGSQTSTVTLTLLLSTFTLTASPSVYSVVAGAPAYYTVLVNPIYDFNQEVLLSCTGTLPPGVGCTFSSSGVTPDGTSPSKVSLKVSTTVSNATGWRPWPRGNHPPPLMLLLGAVWLLLTLLLIFKAGSPATSRAGLRVASRAMILATLCSLLLLLGGCRGLTSSNSPTPTGNYIMTITGTLQSNTNVTESTTVDLAISPTG
jgi:hypothetical protein